MRPPVWQMVKEAADHLGADGKTFTNAAVRDYVNSHWDDVNASTLACQIIICTVNHPSRIHYPENKKPRKANAQYDFLFRVGRGELRLFDADQHGEWEIAAEGSGLAVRQVTEAPQEVQEEERSSQLGSLALESQLRDLLARNLPDVPELGSLDLYQHSDGREGVEFVTDVGNIDLLARTRAGAFCVLELKLERGPDAALGQVQRYMGWVQHHLAGGAPVHGVILAAQIGKKLLYAATQAPNVHLLEYELEIKVRPCRLAT